jgi:hypothetical protein
MGTSGLLVIDQHLLTRGRVSVDRMTAASQKSLAAKHYYRARDLRE